MKNTFYIKRKNFRGFLLTTLPIPILSLIVIVTSLFSRQYQLTLLACSLMIIPVVSYFVSRSRGNMDKFMLDKDGIHVIRGIKKEMAYFPWENVNKLVKTKVKGNTLLQLRLTDQNNNKIQIHTDNIEQFTAVRKQVQGK